MKIWIKYFIFSILAIAFAACDSHDREPDGDDIVGTWICKHFDENESFTMCFKSNGKGWGEWRDEYGDSDEHYDFEYSTHNGKIYFEETYYDDYDDTFDHYSWVCEYTIKGNKLDIYGNPWGEEDDVNHITFTRK